MQHGEDGVSLGQFQRPRHDRGEQPLTQVRMICQHPRQYRHPEQTRPFPRSGYGPLAEHDAHTYSRRRIQARVTQPHTGGR